MQFRRMQGTALPCLALALLVQLVAAGVLRRPSQDPNWDEKKIQSEKEYEKDYTKDGNGASASDVKGIQSEEKYHDDFTTDERPAADAVPVDNGHDHVGKEHEHGGSPGKGRGHMVPRTHVKGATEDHHGEYHWTYSEPNAWGDGFEKCQGKAQSPINIETSKAKGSEGSAQKLSDYVKYQALSGRTVVDHGHNVQVNGEFGTLQLPDGLYNVAQFHFHFPSEHEVNGKLAAGEIHIVHQKQGSHGTDDLAVIGILLEVGSEAAETKDQLAFLKNLGFGKKLPADGEETTVNAPVDLNVFAKELSGEFFHYDGSLTTPPCSQTVHWYVLEQPAVVTKEMVDTFKAIYPAPSNNRPVKGLHGRTVVHSNLQGPDDAKVTKPSKSGAAHIRASLAASIAVIAGLILQLA